MFQGREDVMKMIAAPPGEEPANLESVLEDMTSGSKRHAEPEPITPTKHKKQKTK